MKRLLILTTLVFSAIGINAQHISEQEAMERALRYMGSGTSAIASRMAASGRDGGSTELELAPVKAESIYAFNLEGGGYIIASADSRTLPILGYSDSGSIDWDNLPENMRAWLMQYDDAIATLGDRMDFKDGNLIIDGKPSRTGTRTERAPVEPLIKTHWSSDNNPYYDMAPIYDGHNPEWQGQRCVAGCTAVALAQILNYWQWPKSLPAGLPAYEAVDYMYDQSLSWHIDSLPPISFDWDNMLDEYLVPNYSTMTYDLLGTEAQQQAVATIMRYCGQAMESMYSPVVSNTYIYQCRDALVNHFGYATATWVNSREQFGIDEWEDLVYSELAAGRPIIYIGESPTADAHAFLCDGYDGYGMFHINLGAQGYFNGYYSLSVLNPWTSTNPNEGSGNLGFTKGQNMIIGLDPSLKELKNPLCDKPELWQNKRITVISENAVDFIFIYNPDAAGTATADYALGTIEADGTLMPRFIGNPNDSIIFHILTNTMTVEIDSTVFQAGETLRLHPMIRFRHTPEAAWQLIPPDTIYVDAGRTDDGRFFMEILPYQLEYVDAAITAGLGRIGASSDLTVTIRNHDQTDYIGDIWIKPHYYGLIHSDEVTADTPYTQGDLLVTGAYIRAGQEGEVIFLFNPEQSGLVRFDMYSGNDDYLDSFTMEFDYVFYSYDSYLINNSYLTHEGNHYVYHVELCDRPGVAIPDGVPSDSIYLYACIASEDDVFINEIRLRDEIKDYLRALPYYAGGGNYKFTTEVSLDIEQDGGYYVWSYLNEWLDDEDYIIGVVAQEIFSATVSPTTVPPVSSEMNQGNTPLYDMQGRRLEGTPQQSGVYINGERKILVK